MTGLHIVPGVQMISPFGSPSRCPSEFTNHSPPNFTKMISKVKSRRLLPSGDLLHKPIRSDANFR